MTLLSWIDELEEISCVQTPESPVSNIEFTFFPQSK